MIAQCVQLIATCERNRAGISFRLISSDKDKLPISAMDARLETTKKLFNCVERAR